MENESKIVERVVILETKSEQHDKDIVDLKDTQRMMYEMNTNIKLLVEKIGSTNEEIVEIKDDITGIKCDMSGMKEDINEVKNKNDKDDAKKWRNTVKYIATAVLGAIVALVLKQIGLI